MKNKITAVVTMFSFIVFNLSCVVHTTTKKTKENLMQQHRRSGDTWSDYNIKIIAVLKTSGERIEFHKDRPGRIQGNTVVGKGLASFEIDSSKVKGLVNDAKGNIIKITLKDGKTYNNIDGHIERKKDKFVLTTYKDLSIPLSDVELLWYKKVDPGLTFAATLGGIAVTGLGIAVIIALLKESCPFIYSFDGEKYIFDAEPYGGATCQGLKRTEWCNLEHLHEVNGQYKIMITNEVNETQYTDELRLVIVDHPHGTKVVPDEFGRIHTISQPIIPIQAFDGYGRDLMPYISKSDWIFWQTRTEEKSPVRKKDLKDELIFEFPKPEGAKKVKLIFNACNTLWGSHMVKEFLELYGTEVYDWYDDMNNSSTAYNQMMFWNLSEELYRLQIRVETESGWKTKGNLVGGGPFVSEDKAFILDLSDVTGDLLRIKLTPPAAFWKINYLAVDYTEDLPLKISEINAVEAIDYNGQDVREILAENDNNYLIMPNIGDSAELIFESPAKNYGWERSIILKASGYYDIHLDAKGEPRNEILNRFRTEPGFTLQYAYKEFLKWKKETVEKKVIK